ncbi:MCM DNA helicase complex subunit [Cichlidogyrus casuarinus]|uniref:DNA replication licensing factor MCM3 n=1 Tax=Cichlidogyrus casuarinus TaxID=1844966 RepID=A0ABD2Q1N4_9PLAT
MADTAQQNLLQSEREYVEFFDETVERINALIAQEGVRLIVNINDLRRENPNRAARLIEDCFTELAGAQKALKRVIENINPNYAKEKEDFYVGYEGSFGNKHDDEGNLLETEYGLSVYKDHQSVTIQEMPETAPAGQLPRSVDILIDNDLVDSSKPGDRVQVVGQYRCLPGKRNGYTSASFRSVILANNVKLLSKDTAPMLSEKDISMAILYQLLGGVERSLLNGSRIRGDVNLLLMGDPSVAKSQFLRFVMQVAHRAINTTGRGSSGVGLTAAVTTDQETGERNLEAGAMVLADRGIVCIDEFDKMSDIDRTAIHEVMEQGRVTIAKAGIQAKLNARCSVLGAANPVYGRYDQYKTPMENIGLQDSLLSRFDLLFVLLDTANAENDLAVAQHVIRTHRYRNPGEQEGEALPLQNTQRLLSTVTNLAGHQGGQFEEAGEADEEQVFEENAQFLLVDGGRKRGKKGGKNKDELFTMRFLQKYIHVARDMKPQLLPEAAGILAKNYCELRMQEKQQLDEGGDAVMRRTQPITVRTLETLIRLATANAKARMSREVSPADADEAVELLRYVMFKEVLTKKKRKRARNESGSEESGIEDADLPSEEEHEAPRRRLPAQRTNLAAGKKRFHELLGIFSRLSRLHITKLISSLSK